MTNIRPFQVIMLGVFALFGVLALIFLGSYQSTPSPEDIAYGDRVVIWGTLDATVFDDVFDNITQEDKAFSVVEYYPIDPRSFDSELINAIAEGRSPDLIVLPSDSLAKHRAKLVPIPYETLSRRNFQDTYVDGAEIFALKDGIYALPFAVDPLVMYWNRDMFASNGIAQPPSSWEAVVGQIVPKVTIRDTSRNILQSALAFGEYRNVQNAKKVLIALTIQSGSKLVTENERGYVVSVNQPIVAGARAPLEAALQFYTDFSNANSPLYTWNRAQPTDKNTFISGDLGMYFGLGSEAENIDNKNPNLNFDVAMMPQGASATVRRTYGDFYGFAIPRASGNAQGAYSAALTMTSAKYSDELSRGFLMASPRRDLIARGDSSAYRQIVLESALIARGWLDPAPVASDGIFLQMVEDVVSNRSRISNAVTDAINRLTLEY